MRSSYIANVVALLAEKLSKFIDYWDNVPKFVEDEVSKSATSLHDELEVLIRVSIFNPLLFTLQAVSRRMFSNQSLAVRRSFTKIPARSLRYHWIATLG